MAELALAFDVGDGRHGWCLGDVAKHPPAIVAAGVVDHPAALRRLACGLDNPLPWGATEPDPMTRNRPFVAHAPILERFVVRADDVFAAGGRTMEYGGELSGAWYTATGTKVVKTNYAETCRDMHGKVLKCGKAFEASCALYPSTGGGKLNPYIGTKAKPGPLAALNVRGMYPPDWPSEDKTHHRDAFLALLWWAYRRRALAGGSHEPHGRLGRDRHGPRAGAPAR